MNTNIMLTTLAYSGTHNLYGLSSLLLRLMDFADEDDMLFLRHRVQ